MKQKVSIETAIKDIKELFNITDSSLSKVSESGCFMIDKREYERFDIIDKLQSYFKNRYLDGGQCRIEPITLLWTVFYIEPLGEHLKK